MYEQLYRQNRGLLWHVARRYAWAIEASGCCDLEDLANSAFLGLVRASETYDANRAAWSTWAWKWCSKYVRDALGLRTARGRLNLYACSLDAPISPEDPEGDSLLDSLTDTTLPEIDAALLDDETARIVRQALSELPEAECKAITLTGLQGRTAADAALACAATEQMIRNACSRAMRKLYHDRRLRALVGLEQATAYHRHKGIQACLNSRSSVVEDAVLWRESQRNSIRLNEWSDCMKWTEFVGHMVVVAFADGSSESGKLLSVNESAVRFAPAHGQAYDISAAEITDIRAI